MLSVDGNDPDAIDAALTEAKVTDRPTLIACKTIIALGRAHRQDTAKAHGSPLGDDEIAKVREAYGWPHPPFEVPAEVKARWRGIGARGGAERERVGGAARRPARRPPRRDRPDPRRRPAAPPRRRPSARSRSRRRTASPKVATRRSSEMVLEVVNPIMPETIGGSADLTGSNNTLTPDLGMFAPENRKGRYIHYGIREHGMAAAMNGIVAARRAPALRRHVPVLHRLLRAAPCGSRR